LNHYEFLGVSRDASDDEIKNAYKRMAKKYHPDVTEGCPDYALEKMQQINAAYGVLINNASREEYDYSLWLDEKADKDAFYNHEFRDYVPRSPAEYQSPWQKFYKKAKKPKTATSKACKNAKKIMAVVWALRFVLPVILLVIIIGIITNAAYMTSFLDSIYGRGSPAKVTEMFIDSIKNEDFKRASIYTQGSFERLVFVVSSAYSFEHEGIPFGEIWFSRMSRELQLKPRETRRFGFSGAELTVEVTSLNIQEIFTLAEQRILEDIQNYTSKWILLQAMSEKNISLVAQVYEEYISDIMNETPPEYLSATATLRFNRPYANWHITGADDINSFRNVLLGGFGEFELGSYITIDWVDVLRIS
jgi:curved DNA-binding protein CbpA